MVERLVIADFKTGYETDRKPFNVNNDAFPILHNAYEWRGRIKKKRGLSFLGRLRRALTSKGLGSTNGSGLLTANTFQGPITGATNANPCVITSAGHDLYNGQRITISGVGGMTQLNGNTYTVTVLTSSTFSLNTDSSAFGVYTTGGIWIWASEPYAAVAQNTSTITIGTQTFDDSNGDSILLQKTGAGYVTAITGITLPTSTTALISITDPNYTVGMQVYVSGVTGMTQINGSYYTITSVNAGVSITVTTPTNTSWGAYTAGGTAYRVAGSINYSSGAVSVQTVPALATTAATITFKYYPDIPVMGLEDFLIQSSTNSAPQNVFTTDLIAFDTIYSYQFNQASLPNPGQFYNVNFFKNPRNNAGSPRKAAAQPFAWSGEDYQQFWSTNYSGAFWATNGKPGMNYGKITAISRSAAAQITVTIQVGGAAYTSLVNGDLVWFNEVQGTTITNVNGFTGYVSSAAGSATGVYVVTMSQDITITAPTANTGIVQFLTNTVPGQDGIKWYDGDPTAASSTKGWVNFAPPLQQFSANTGTAIVANPQYLVGCQAILPFKGRLCAFGAWTMKSTDTTPTYNQDMVVFSAVGTPYYTLDNNFATSPAGSGTQQTYPVPDGQSATLSSWYQTSPVSTPGVGVGIGGFQAAGISQPIVTINNNEDVLLIGFTNKQTRFVFTGNDLAPFAFYSINSEIGSDATFSSITLDAGGLTFGRYGLAMSTQYSTQRIDLQIPDQVFQVPGSNNGYQRICSIRDFRNEWIFFTVPYNQNTWKFPTLSLFFNYRENTWATLDENFTTYGNFRETSGTSWENLEYDSWSEWNEPWNSGTLTADYPLIIGGNQQGFVMKKEEEGTDDDSSGYISNIVITGSGDSSTITITSPNHCLLPGDYIIIENATGTIASTINGYVRAVTIIDANSFYVDHDGDFGVPDPSGTYNGGATFIRLVNPYIQTKQFPIFWGEGRQVRLGVQKYLFDKTQAGQLTALIFLNQDAANPSNGPPYVPDNNNPNESVVFSDVVFTSSEVGGYGGDQIWHRQNTSLVGDTVQIAFTLSDAQMRTLTEGLGLISQNAEISLHAIVLDLYPGPQLAAGLFV